MRAVRVAFTLLAAAAVALPAAALESHDVVRRELQLAPAARAGSRSTTFSAASRYAPAPATALPSRFVAASPRVARLSSRAASRR
jgi:hypothetical protein